MDIVVKKENIVNHFHWHFLPYTIVEWLAFSATYSHNVPKNPLVCPTHEPVILHFSWQPFMLKKTIFIHPRLITFTKDLLHDFAHNPWQTADKFKRGNICFFLCALCVDAWNTIKPCQLRPNQFKSFPFRSNPLDVIHSIATYLNVIRSDFSHQSSSSFVPPIP